MRELIEPIEQTSTMLRLRLKDPHILDLQMIRLMANDRLCLPCLIEDEEKGILMYTHDHFVPLSYFLEQYSFEKEDGYLFLKQLFSDAICSNRNKPVLLDPEYVFVSSYGDAFRFVVLPIQVQYWMFQQDVCKKWIAYIQDHFQTSSAYEIPGYLMKFIKTKEMSLPNLIIGLDEMRAYYYPKKWYKKKQTTFKAKEAVQVYQNLNVQALQNETQILSDWQQPAAYLQKGEEKLYLKEGINLVGRSEQCDLRLSYADISQTHAKISYNDEKYYIQDLKSKNGTYLNQKKVQRKMRLKEGMHVVFGNHEYLFHEKL